MLQKKSVVLTVLGLLTVFILAIYEVASQKTALAAPAATTWYVDAATGDDSDDCLAPATACLTVGGAVDKASSGDSIQIAAGMYIENLDINIDLAFVGAGMDLTLLDGGQSGRVLTTASSDISLAHLTVQNGSASGSNMDGKGGGIFNYNHLVLDHVRVMNNASQQGGAGIFTSGPILIQNSQVISNTSEGVGGGIEIWFNGTVTLTQSLVGWNTASMGGGVFTTGQFHGIDSTLDGNQSAVYGGGLANSGTGQVHLESVTISHNQTDGYGAGLLNELGSMEMNNVTVSANSAPNYVGIANINETAQMTITNSTIAENIVTGAGTRYGGVVNLYGILHIQNSIVANNDNRQCMASGTWSSLGYNLSSDSYCAFNQAGDTQSTDPELAPLANYGGPTWTHALTPASPAIDTGTNTGCPAVDQRGVARPFDGDRDGTPVCDKGAFEALVQITVDDIVQMEGDTGTSNAVFTVTLSPTSTQVVTVDYATSDGTAAAGSDYQAVNGILTFDPGEAVQTIIVPVYGDTTDEADETFMLDLSNASNADILDGAALAIIVDDDGLPSLTVEDVSKGEGNSGTTNALFTITLSPADTQEVTVAYATASGTAIAGEDFSPTSGTLTFAPGDTTQTVPVAIFGDMIDEGSLEAFTLELSDPVNANLGDASAKGTILDDDTATISIGNSQPLVEGNLGTSSLTFTVTLSLPTAFPVTVDYYTQSGTGGAFATPGVDYAEASGTLSFVPGETLKTFDITVYGDIQDEQDENFSAYLLNADPISIYGSASTGFILDDDEGVTQVFLPLTIK